MRKILVFTLILAFAVQSCTRVPITNRKQLNLLPESELIAMAKVNYEEFLSTAQVLPDTDPRAIRVKRVGDNLVAAVEK